MKPHPGNPPTLLTRRGLLGGALSLPLVLGGARLSLAQGDGDNRFVLVILRGGMDGLSAVPPLGDPDYRRLRPDLALGEPGTADGAFDLDGFFGLHPALVACRDLYAGNELLVVHAVATPYRKRSHFDAQNVLETGGLGPNMLYDGWLNRALAAWGAAATDRGLAIAQTPPLVLQGATTVASWAPSTMPDLAPDVMAMVQALYARDPLLGPALEDGLRTRALAGPKGRSSGDLASLAATAGRILAQPEGPRIAMMESNGWDTHANQGAGQGQLGRHLAGLDAGFAALRDGMGDDAWSRTVVVAVTEFGRTAAQNGTRGTDHGTASAAFVLGGAVDGGRVLTQWPGLARDSLYEGRDLAPVIDMRAIFNSVLTDHLGLEPGWVDAHVFPGGRIEAIAPLVRA